MKKVCIILLITHLAMQATALSEKSFERFFEIGGSPSVNMSSNYFKLKDFFKKDVVFDLRKIADEMPRNGLKTAVLFSAPDYFVNLNLKNGWKFGLMKLGIEGDMRFNFSKQLFDVLGYGNADMGETIEEVGSISADVFYYFNTSASFKVKKFNISVSPSLFVPVAHFETNDMGGSLTNKTDGSLSVNLLIDGTLYSCVDTKPIFDGQIPEFTVAGLVKNMGFDLGSSVSYPIFDTLQVGGYMRLPIVPGKLRHAASIKASMSYTVESIAGVLINDTEAKFEPALSDIEYGTPTFKISRPFRMGAEAVYCPFNNWLTLSGLFGFGVKYPYTKTPKGYVEYKFGVVASVYNALSVGLSTAYLSQVFIHEAELKINARVLEIDVAVSAQSPNFKYSFTGAGLGARIGVAVGF